MLAKELVELQLTLDIVQLRLELLKLAVQIVLKNVSGLRLQFKQLEDRGASKNCVFQLFASHGGEAHQNHVVCKLIRT